MQYFVCVKLIAIFVSYLEMDFRYLHKIKSLTTNDKE